MMASSLLSLGLLALSGWLIDQHRNAWRTIQGDGSLDSHYQHFARGQYRRRMIASSAIGVVAVLLALHMVVPQRPIPMTLYLASLMIGCLVIFAGGVFDAFAGARYLRQTQRREARRQAKLAIELLQASKQQQSSSDEA